MFFVAAGILVFAMLSVAQSQGGRESLRLGWLISLLLLPTYLTFQMGSLLIDLRTVTGVVGLICLAIGKKTEHAPGSKAVFKVEVSDLLILALFLIQVISQRNVGRIGPLTAPDIARRWVLPYAVGRVFYGSRDEVRASFPIIARLLLVLSVYAIVESITKINIVNVLLGKRYGLLEQGEGYRWGLKRAQGFTDHPIFFGMMLVLIFPFSIESGRLASKDIKERWRKVVPFLTFGAIIGTVSRGAQIASVFTMLVSLFFAKPKWRKVMLVLAVFGGIGVVVGKEVLSDVLSKWAGESHEEVRIIQIQGEDVEYTGTNHRILLFKVYEDALAHTGWFGFGFELRGIELEESIAQRFGSIDDHYILFLLQHGYSALVVFLLLSVNAMVELGRTAFRKDHVASNLAGSLFGAMLAVTVSLLSVWFAPDFGLCFLFCVGVATNLRSLPSNPKDGADPEKPKANEEPPKTIKRRLVFGHAPVRKRSA